MNGELWVANAIDSIFQFHFICQPLSSPFGAMLFQPKSIYPDIFLILMTWEFSSKKPTRITQIFVWVQNPQFNWNQTTFYDFEHVSQSAQQQNVTNKCQFENGNGLRGKRSRNFRRFVKKNYPLYTFYVASMLLAEIADRFCSHCGNISKKKKIDTQKSNWARAITMHQES